MKYEDMFTPEAAASILNSCILFCDLIVTGKNSAVGLKYDEENMYAPMIVFLEKDGPADVLVWAAQALGVPVIKNINMAKNLMSYGSAGKTIPEVSFREVSLAFVRASTSSARNRHPSRDFEKKRGKTFIKVNRPLYMELGTSLFALTGEEPGREILLGKPLDAIRKKLKHLLGFAIPSINVKCSSKLKNDEYRIVFRGLEAGRGRLELGWYLNSPANCSNNWHGSSIHTAMPAVPDRMLAQPDRMPAVPDIMSIPENIKIAAKAAASVLVRHIDEIVQRRAPELLGRDEVEAILDAAEEKYPVVTGEVKSFLSLGVIREILQGLVSEQVSIRHITVILETLADWGTLGPAPCDLIIEQIRQSLKRQICLEYTDDRQCLRVLTLEPKLDKGFADQVNFRGDDISGETEEKPEDLASIISFAASQMQEKGFPPVVLCSPRARASVKEATRRKFPDLAVLSYLEIPSDISVEPLGEIRLPKI